MSAFPVSFTNRRVVLLAVMSLVASLVAIGVRAPAALAAPGVTITESAASTDVTEGGATDSYDVVLDEIPTGTVTITVTPDAQVSVDKGTLTFLTSDWDTPQTVTVTAVNDDIAEGAHTGTISHTAASSDTNYNGIMIANVTANVTDNDTAGIVVTETGGNTTVTEGGATDSYNISLTSEPTDTGHDQRVPTQPVKPPLDNVGHPQLR